MARALMRLAVCLQQDGAGHAQKPTMQHKEDANQKPHKCEHMQLMLIKQWWFCLPFIAHEEALRMHERESHARHIWQLFKFDKSVLAA